LVKNKKFKIIIIDNSKECIKKAISILSRDEYEISVAQNCVDALELLEIESFDLILICTNIPDSEIGKICYNNKSHGKNLNTPVIFILERTDLNCISDVFKNGGIDYIQKPFIEKEFVSKVKTHLEHRYFRDLLIQEENELKIEIEKSREHEKELLKITKILEKANVVLSQMSLVDALTGIANRRDFDRTLELEWKRCRRDKLDLSLIMLDIDHFKNFNDMYGHLAGDECLKDVVEVIKSNIKRPADKAARFGGEEFILILPETDVNGAFSIAESIRKDVISLKIPHESSPVSERVTISAGISSIIPDTGVMMKKLIENADKALYRAKSNGRNRVEI